MNETFKQLLLAFAAGLFLGLIFWWHQWRAARALRRETARLYEQLALDMRIRDRGHKSQLDELENLRMQNENLRITVSTLRGKPGRAELDLLHIYDRAIHEMCQRAPGFAPTWELLLREAREEMAKTDSGIIAFVRRAFRPSLGQSAMGQIADVPQADAGDGPKPPDPSRGG